LTCDWGAGVGRERRREWFDVLAVNSRSIKALRASVDGLA
jgi:hypothetical protein